MHLIDLIGYLAAACTTLSFIPQVVKVYKTKSTHDISLGMFVTFFMGIAFWLVYGIMQNAIPIIMANSITLFLSGYVLICKLKYK
jgi:MtN3 and saliva related transmembrane protein